MSARPPAVTPAPSRRDFLAASAAAAAALGTTAQAGAQTAAPSSHDVPAFELEELAIADLQARMASGQDTSLSITEQYLARIAALDKKGPALNQVLELNGEARDEAKRLDAERKAGRVRGPLHGIPILLKDNIDTTGPMTTTAGSLAMEGCVPPRDAFIVRRLRAAGAVILGKTNLSEWANFRSEKSTSGWSGRGGLGRNPYALDRNTSGSSSGSGAAAAANYAAGTIGTETDGSIVSPSNNCCLVGLKPTVGLVSRTGIVPISHSQDTAGPMTRTVADAAALLTAIAGVDPDDDATKGAAERAVDFTRFLDPNGLKGARIGIPRLRLFGYSAHSDRIAGEAIAAMQSLGATVIDPVVLDVPADLWQSELEVLLYEFKADLNAYLARLWGVTRVKSLAEIIRFNEEHAAREMPYFGQELFIKAEAKGPLTEAAYLDALAKNHQLSRELGIDKVMDEHSLDALVAPTGAPAWLTDLINGDSWLGSASSVPAIAGYPHITVPGGFASGLPVGISFIGRAWSEPVLIRLAYAFEQATKHRRPPRFLPTAGLHA
jgi:amidase